MLILAFISLLYTNAFANEDLCISYEEFCNGYMRSTGSNAYPSLLSGIGVNPSLLPTAPSPLNIELGYNTTGDFSSSGISVGGMKGMKGHGFGFARTKNNTFYTYSAKQALQGTSVDISDLTSPLTGQRYSFAGRNFERTTTVFSYAQSLFPKATQITPALGVSGVIDSLSSTLNFAFGASIKSKLLSLAWSYLPLGSNTARNVPKTSTSHFDANLSLGGFSANYSLLNYRTTESSLSPLKLFSDPVNIYTLAYDSTAFHVTLARRESTNILNRRVHLDMVAILWRVSKTVSVNFMENYIPGAHSLGFEFFF